MAKNIFIIALLPLVTITALRRMTEQRCKPSDHADAIRFGTAPTLSASDQKIQKDFVDLVRYNKLSDVLYTTRHRVSLPKCCNPLPQAFRFFDWHVDMSNLPDNTSHPNPTAIFCLDFKPSLTKMSQLAEKLPALKPGQKRLLAIGNNDTHYDQISGMIDHLVETGKFSRVLFESKNVYTDKVGTFPLGLSDFYLENSGPNNARHAIVRASLEKKNQTILAAWGKVWSILDKEPSRQQGDQFLEKSCLVKRSDISPSDWWNELARSRFLMTPHGGGIQLPKVAEALLTLTIPIVQRIAAFEDLKTHYGWPLVLVDKWDEITPENLKKWHEELSPKLHSFRWHLTTQQALQDIVERN